MKLLAIDTASARCSVALLLGTQLAHRAVDTARDHATLILPMVDEVLREAGTSLRALDGIAFGRGPGSFTGLRVAAAVTQGLAAGAGLPVLGISDLRALAAQARRALGTGPARGLVLAAMDARMGEIYWGAFDAGPGLPGEALQAEAVGPPSGPVQRLGGPLQAGAGKGFSAYPALVAQLGIDPRHVLADAEPDAADIARLAASDLAGGAAWQDATQAQPVYLRDQVVQATR